MRSLRWLILLAPLAIAGCFSYSEAMPSHTTVVVPPGSVVTCSGGGLPPC